MRALLVLLLLAAQAPRPIVQSPPATLSYGALLTYGTHAIGWRFDPRPVPVTVFYPADVATGEETTLGDFVQLANEGPPLSGSAKMPVKSRRQATPSAGRFPLVLFAHATPVAQFVMSEYLASHGFVVAGVMPRTGYRLSADAVRAMVADLETGLRVVRALPVADSAPPSVIGMSNGAFGAVGLGLRLPVASIVSLDGTIAERAAARILPELSPATPALRLPPLLHLYTPDNPYLDLEQLKARGPACTAVRIPAIAHADFLSYGALLPVGPPPFTRLRPAEKFAAINRLTLAFLSRHATHLTDGDRVLGLEQHRCEESPKSR